MARATKTFGLRREALATTCTQRALEDTRALLRTLERIDDALAGDHAARRRQLIDLTAQLHQVRARLDGSIRDAHEAIDFLIDDPSIDEISAPR